MQGRQGRVKGIGGDEHENFAAGGAGEPGGLRVPDTLMRRLEEICLGNAVKYISRAGKKDPTKTIEDLQKAVWYLNHEIEKRKREAAQCTTSDPAQS